MSKERESQIDILRGVAVFTMICANMAPSLLRPPHPFGIRIYGTFAAPIFIFLSGMMIAMVMAKRREPFSYFAGRGVTLMAIASLMDMGLYHVMPMICVDVLCLIGLSLMVIFPLMRLDFKWRILLAVFIFVATPLLHSHFGYSREYFYAFLKDGVWALSGKSFLILRNWLLQAAFPLFPWMGYAMMGSAVGAFRWGSGRLQSFNSPVAWAGSLSLLVLGVIVFLAAPGPLMIRFYYSELFYPPTMGFFLTSFGVIGCLFCLVDRFPGLPAFQWLRPFGESSLFVYVTHYVIIRLLLVPLMGLQPLGIFLVLYAALAIVLYLLCLLLRRLRPLVARLPMPLRLVFGT